MNPNAPQFAPTDLVMVKHDGAVKAAESEDRPNDLIFHEALKHLIQEVREMKARAASIEQENVNLKQENSEVKAQIKSLRQVFIDGSARAAKGNLIGYAVSETSSMDLTQDSRDVAAADLKKKLEYHQATVTQILEKFNESLSGESGKREGMQKDITEIHNILRVYKGRTGALESKFRTMAVDVDELEVAVQNLQNEGNFVTITKNDPALSTYAQDQMEKLDGKVKEVTRRLKSLEDDVDAHRCVLNDFSHGQNNKTGWGFHNGSGGGSVSNNDGWASASATNQNGWIEDKSDRVNAGKLQDQLTTVDKSLDAFQRSVDNRTKDKRTIDNCPTRDRLYELYHQFTQAMDNASNSEDQDDLWELRDRVLVRLAIFDLYGIAVKEAKAAETDL